MKLKRILCTVLAALLLAGLNAALAAEEVAFTPAQEEFNAANLEQIETRDALYCLNGTDGYVAVYETPDGRDTAYFLNEQTVSVRALYTKNARECWALILYTDSGDGVCHEGTSAGWVNMKDIYRTCSTEQFAREHIDEFINETVTLDMREYNRVYLWSYPGCEGVYLNAKLYVRTDADNVLEFPAYWVDSEGRRWGGYRFFDAEGFICLDDPSMTVNSLPEIEGAAYFYPAAPLSALPHASSYTAPVRRSISVAAATALAAAAILAVLGAGTALYVLFRRRRKQNDETKFDTKRFTPVTVPESGSDDHTEETKGSET